MEKLYPVSKNKTESWLWLRSWTPYCKIRLKLKKVGKSIRPKSNDLNQIPYDYTMEVTNRFKELELIECLKNYGWRFMTLYRRQWSRSSPRKRNAKGKMVVWGGLTNSLAQRLKRLPAMRETPVRSLGREDPLEEEMATHSSILAWRIPWRKEPGRLQSMGSQRVGHDWAT